MPPTLGVSAVKGKEGFFQNSYNLKEKCEET
jgi:hypothetical protein